eukprot:TCONS_00034391-protein
MDLNSVMLVCTSLPDVYQCDSRKITQQLAITITTIISLPVLYLMILFVFKKSRKQVAITANSTIQQELNAQVTERISKKLVRRSLWLIGVYFACTGLTVFSYTLYAYGVIESGYLYQITNIIFLGNSCANPCIYMFKDKKIRKIAKATFKKSQEVSL